MQQNPRVEPPKNVPVAREIELRPSNPKFKLKTKHFCARVYSVGQSSAQRAFASALFSGLSSLAATAAEVEEAGREVMKEAKVGFVSYLGVRRMVN